MCEELAGVGCHGFEKGVLRRSQVQICARPLDQPLDQIDLEIVEDKHWRSLRPILAATKCRSKTSQKFIDIERLRDVVVGTRVQRSDLVFLGFSHRQHDDWDLAPRPESTDDFSTIHVWKPEVQHDQSWLLCSRQGKTFFPTIGRQHFITARLKRGSQGSNDLRLVVDD